MEEVVYDYNLRNRLSEATTTRYVSGSPSETHTTQYRYNPDGIRTAKIEDAARWTDYLIDSFNHTGYAQVLEETAWEAAGAGGWLPTSRIQYTLGDDVISQTRSTPGTGVWTASPTQYLLYDGHGSTRQLVNSDLTLSGSYSYDGYGVMLSDNSRPEPQAQTSLLYTGEQFDTTLDQYYLRARYYNQSNGRFNQMDPYAGISQYPQSLHKYTYCHNNPINGIDPSGMLFTAIGQLVITGIRALMSGIATFSVAAYMWAATNMALITSVSYYAMWTFIISSLWVGAEQQGYLPEITLVGNWTVAKATQVVSGSVFFLGLMIINSVPDLERDKIARNVQTRVYELRQQMSENVRGRVTMSVGVAQTKSGERVLVLGTSEPNAYLRNGITLKSNEILVSGTGHAENDVVNFCRQQGWNLLSIGATRPLCETCVETIAPTGADIVTPIKGEMLQGAN